MAGSHSAKGSKVCTGGTGGRGATEAKARSLEGRLPDLPGHSFQNTCPADQEFPGCGDCVLLCSISPGLGTGSGTQQALNHGRGIHNLLSKLECTENQETTGTTGVSGPVPGTPGRRSLDQ